MCALQNSYNCSLHSVENIKSFQILGKYSVPSRSGAKCVWEQREQRELVHARCSLHESNVMRYIRSSPYCTTSNMRVEGSSMRACSLDWMQGSWTATPLDIAVILHSTKQLWSWIWQKRISCKVSNLRQRRKVADRAAIIKQRRLAKPCRQASSWTKATAC